MGGAREEGGGLTAGVGDGVPRAALVGDLDTGPARRAQAGADLKRAARQPRIAVDHGVRGKLRQAHEGIVGDGPAVQVPRQEPARLPHLAG